MDSLKIVLIELANNIRYVAYKETDSANGENVYYDLCQLMMDQSRQMHLFPCSIYTGISTYKLNPAVFLYESELTNENDQSNKLLILFKDTLRVHNDKKFAIKHPPSLIIQASSKIIV